MMMQPTNNDARSTAESRRDKQPSNNDSVQSNSPGFGSFLSRILTPSAKRFIFGEWSVAAAAEDKSPRQHTAGDPPTVNAGSSAHESRSGSGLDERSVSMASRRSQWDKQHGAQLRHGDDELEVYITMVIFLILFQD